MAQADSSDDQELTVKWMQIANAVAHGRLMPEEGIAELEALAESHPVDREWLRDEIETIRRQFGLDVTDHVERDLVGYWEKMRLVIDALLDDRLDHERALRLLKSIDAQHPEQAQQTERLIAGLAESPMRRAMNEEVDDQVAPGR
jgi:hypothetical protein